MSDTIGTAGENSKEIMSQGPASKKPGKVRIRKCDYDKNEKVQKALVTVVDPERGITADDIRCQAARRETGVAEIISPCLKDKFLLCAEEKKVYRFQGTTWKEDVLKRYVDDAVGYAEKILRAAAAAMYPVEGLLGRSVVNVNSAINTTLNIQSQNRVIRKALESKHSVSVEEFDKDDQETLNTPYGLINLRDGAVRATAPSDLRRMCTNVSLPPKEMRDLEPTKTLKALRDIFLPVGMPSEEEKTQDIEELKTRFQSLVEAYDDFDEDEKKASALLRGHETFGDPQGTLLQLICTAKQQLDEAMRLQSACMEKKKLWESGVYLDEMMNFLQVLLGYMLLGTNNEQLMVIFLGDRGRNGKGLLCHLLRDILGDYAMEVRSSVFMKGHNRDSGAPTPELMALEGKRCVIASENDRNDQLNASLLKRITGHDHMTGRQLYGQERSYQPRCVIFLESNFMPRFDTQDEALLTRAVCVLFARHFEDNPEKITPFVGQKDPLLEEKLKDEYELFLNWMVKGAVRYFQEGLNVPEFIEANKDSCRKERDTLELFISECCVLEPGTTGSRILYQAYNQWCRESGIAPLSAPNFRKSMETKGFVYKKNSQMLVHNIKLNLEGLRSLDAFAQRMGYRNN